MKFTDKWKELNNYLILTEMVQTPRDKSSIFSFRCWVLAWNPWMGGLKLAYSRRSGNQ